MKTLIVSTIALVAGIGVSFSAPPVVSNVSAAQRAGTKFVDITYNLSDADGDLQNVQVQISGDAGLTYTIPATALSGHVGAGVAPGNGRTIVWNAGVDWNGQYVPLGKVRVTASDGTTFGPPPGMAFIPAGTFQMGDNLDGVTDAMPVHSVHVDGFFMDRFEVSKELWQSVQIWGSGHGYAVSVGGFKAPGHPVQSVSWYDVVKWCNARSEKEGLTPCYYTDDAQTLVYRTGNLDLTNTKVKWSANGYRLPTEAEWEKAARGATLGQRYPWGNELTGTQANYQLSGDAHETGPQPFTTPVGYYDGLQTPTGVDMANGYGLYDMAGNVWEWCWDMYDSAYYGNVAANNNPRGPSNTYFRVVRGGTWNSTSTDMRCAYRSAAGAPAYNSSLYGFRCAKGL